MAGKQVRGQVLQLRDDPKAKPDRCWAKKVITYDPGVPGLLVTRSVGGAGWVILHKDSGLMVAFGFGKKDTALSFCEEVLAPLTDWTIDPEAQDVGLQGLILEAQRQAIADEQQALEATRAEKKRQKEVANREELENRWFR